MLNTNVWSGTQDSLRVLDDLEPVAPMDRFAPSNDEIAELPGSVPNSPALYVPPYLKPDPFPTVHGPSCTCIPSAAGSDRPPACTCKYADGRHSSNLRPPTYKWTKIDAVPGTREYVVSAADPTYPNGDYWRPTVLGGGVVAPLDKMPEEHYPAQAPRDLVRPMPTVAREDTVWPRYTKYLDQVEARSRNCDRISAECTTPCYPGDVVEIALGNVKFMSKISRAFIGNAVSISYAPGLSNGQTKVCGLNEGCTVFRPCYSGGDKPCVALRDKKTHNFAGNLMTSTSCPMFTTLCQTVDQIIDASFATKIVDGVPWACRAAAEGPPAPSM